MSEQPFRPEDVLHRYTPPGLGEIVFAKSGPSNVYPVTMYYRAGHHWECTSPGMRDVAEILRQFATKDEQIAQLRDDIRLAGKVMEHDRLLIAGQDAQIAKLKALLQEILPHIGLGTGGKLHTRILEAVK